MSTVRYILKMSDNSVRAIEVPEEWNLTFGQIVPVTKHQPGYNQDRGYGLRFYEGAKTTGKTKMVISGVREFWPDTIKIKEKTIETKRKTYGHDAPEGFENSVVEARVEKWVNIEGGDEEDDEENYFLEKIEDTKDIPF